MNLFALSSVLCPALDIRYPFYLSHYQCNHQCFLPSSVIFYSFLTTRFAEIYCLPQFCSRCTKPPYQVSVMSCTALPSSTLFHIQLPRSLVGLESRSSLDLIPIDFSRSPMGLQFYRINFWERHPSRELALMRFRESHFIEFCVINILRRMSRLTKLISAKKNLSW